jgi:hypothetical protein
MPSKLANEFAPAQEAKKALKFEDEFDKPPSNMVATIVATFACIWTDTRIMTIAIEHSRK